MNRHSRLLRKLAVAAVLLLPWNLQGQSLSVQEEDDSPYSEARLVSEMTSVQPGRTFTVAVRFDLEPGWHNYWRNAGDSGLPTTIQWDLPPGFTAGEIQWPHPHRIVAPPLVDYGYSDRIALLVDLTPPEELQAGSSVTLSARVDWLICKEICLPAFQHVELDLPVRAEPPTPDPSWTDLFERTRQRLPRPVPGWEAEARWSEEGYRLAVYPQDPGLGAPDSVYFFAAETSVIAHAASQHPELQGDTLVLSLEASPYAARPVSVLEGVLLAVEGGSWDPTGGVEGLQVRAPVAGVPEPPAGGPERDEAGIEGVSPRRGTDDPMAGSADTAVDASSAGASSVTLALALVLAFLGGVLLNLMPCVFPVLSIKILGVAGQAGGDRETVRQDGIFFGLGVVFSFLALAGLLVALRAGGRQLGWGFQLQSPPFVAFLTGLFFIIGLNLMGTFEIGAALTRLGNRIGASGGKGEALASGVLATVVATPCTAPFMGTALGFAITRPLSQILLIFGMLGVGMAMPYVLLSVTPGLMRRLPRPGPWMETLRNILAFPIFATVIWLVWVFGQQTGITGTAYLLAAFLLLSLGGWALGHWPRADLRSGRLARAVAVLAMVAAVGTGWKGSGMEGAAAVPNEGWQPFSREEITRLLDDGQPVFVDFTAAWCLTCQVNERLVLSTEEVQAAFRERNVSLFKADWTRQDPVITEALGDLGRNGVPVYALYPGGSSREPHLLPAILTKEIVLNALERVLSSP